MSQMTADERSRYRVTKARPRFRREGLGRVGILEAIKLLCLLTDPARLGWRADGTLTTTHPRHSRRSRTWRRRKAEEFPEDTRNLKAAEELERLAAEIETLEHSEIHQQICDMQERIDRMMTAIFGFGLWSVRQIRGTSLDLVSRQLQHRTAISRMVPRLVGGKASGLSRGRCFRLRGTAHPVINSRTSEHHILAPALECSDVRLVAAGSAKRVLELRCPVTVPRAIGSLKSDERRRGEYHVLNSNGSADVMDERAFSSPKGCAARPGAPDNRSRYAAARHSSHRR